MMRSIAYIGSAASVTPTRRRPRLVNHTFGATTDPALPASGALWTSRQTARDSFLVSATANGTTPPSIDGLTPLTTFATNNVSGALYWLAGSTSAYAWIGANHHRSLVHLRDVGRIAYRVRNRTGGASAGVTWGPLPAGDGDIPDEITSAAIVGGHLITDGVQTDVDNATTGVGLGDPFITRFEAQSTRARFAFDSGGVLPSAEGSPAETLFTDMAEVARLLDTNSAYANVLWAAEGIMDL